MDRDHLHFEVAVVVSLLLHALTLGCWEYREALARFPLFKPLAALAHMLAPPSYARTETAEQTITFVEAPVPKPAPEPPQQFMETDASQATGEQPKNARYYSDKSTVAANRKNASAKSGETPYLAGKQVRMMSTENVAPQLGGSPVPAAPPPAPASPPSPPPSAPIKAQESPPAAVKSEPPREVPAQGLKIVEDKKLAMATPDEISPSRVAAPPNPVRPRPSEPAGAPSDRELAALKSKLVVSGVTKIGIDAFNVEASPLGVYDKQLIKAVQSRWYALINKNQLDTDGEGTVVVQFQLLEDGTVQGVKTKESTVGIVLSSFCELAILQSAPFEPLPEGLRVLVGNAPREIDFTFQYY